MENETPIQPTEPTEVQLAASQLGKRGRGKAKTLTPEDRQRRVDQMGAINEKRRTVRVQGIVVNSPGGNTTVQQRVKAPQSQQVTNPERRFSSFFSSMARPVIPVVDSPRADLMLSRPRLTAVFRVQ